MLETDVALIQAVSEYHIHGGLDGLRKAVEDNPLAAPVLREMGNNILRFKDVAEVPLEVEGDRATNDPAFMALWDVNNWVVWGDPEDLFEEVRDTILPAMDTDATMNAYPAVQGLFLLLLDKAVTKIWDDIENIDEDDISPDDVEVLQDAVQAFAEKHGIYTED